MDKIATLEALAFDINLIIEGPCKAARAYLWEAAEGLDSPDGMDALDVHEARDKMAAPLYALDHVAEKAARWSHVAPQIVDLRAALDAAVGAIRDAMEQLSAYDIVAVDDAVEAVDGTMHDLAAAVAHSGYSLLNQREAS